MSCITREPDTDDVRWDAVVRHDTTADGTFYYSVRTTGVYCRPSCPARQARRENVAFHATAAEAEAAGFRPCRRCRPTEAPLSERRADAVTRACRLIEESGAALSLDELATAVGMSRYHFHRVFRETTGVTPKAYADARRADRVRAELTARPTVTDAIYSAGFESSGRFYATAPATLGMSPSEYRSGGRGAAIRFGVGQCSLGAIVVAASDSGICAILLGDEPDELVRDLQDRFPEADLIGGDPEFEQWMAQVVGFVEAPAVGLDLPLDVRGTAFQRRVWQALREVPSGTTTSYSRIAERIGAPKSVRAVAQACAANNLAVAIPCHRIVRTDGGLAGYRWGIERKRALLDREAVG
jgi:AraC family transcriptional regulator of adaptative response/methylated-DNA-[protein]-cysteine methyltransferase